MAPALNGDGDGPSCHGETLGGGAGSLHTKKELYYTRPPANDFSLRVFDVGMCVCVSSARIVNVVHSCFSVADSYRYVWEEEEEERRRARGCFFAKVKEISSTTYYYRCCTTTYTLVLLSRRAALTKEGSGGLLLLHMSMNRRILNMWKRV